ncbi:dihydrofolate reductase family protein [Actinoplanes sp. NPDC049265]|uniref:dihydrofolate reductase family protein n=1 Tax=Actinoplanes sp. NPDC049265 TaxID=3363902 RepID=UPI00371DB277
MTEVRRLWPDQSGPLDDDALRDCYAYPAGRTLRVNFVSSVDGAATVDGRSGGLGGPGDKRIFDLLRAGCDALLVGANTLRTEGYDALRPDPEWRKANGLPAYPIMSILSSSLDLDPDQAVFAEAPQPPIVFTVPRAAARTAPDAVTRTAPEAATRTAPDTATRAHPAAATRAHPAADPGAAPADLGAELIAVSDLAGAVAALRQRGAANILCEGGPSLFGQLIAADLVDELCLTISPRLAGGNAGRIAHGPPTEAREMALRHVLTDGNQLFLRYAREQPLVDKAVDDH